MILVLWLARSLWFVSRIAKVAGDAAYSVHFDHQGRKLEREREEKERADRRRVDAIIEDVIAETRPVKRTFDESPFNGETR